MRGLQAYHGVFGTMTYDQATQQLTLAPDGGGAAFAGRRVGDDFEVTYQAPGAAAPSTFLFAED